MSAPVIFLNFFFYGVGESEVWPHPSIGGLKKKEKKEMEKEREPSNQTVSD